MSGKRAENSGPASGAGEQFSSRWGILAAALGIAVGTGNIWRFPRVAALNGGGVFILLWLVFLFLWSLPLLVAESSLGRGSRRGTVGSFAALMGRRGVWMGAFVALVTTGIMCYYSVVTGWCLKYTFSALTGAVNERTGPAYWQEFAGSWSAGGWHLAAVLVSGFVVFLGIRAGIERTARIFIPALGAILVYSAVRAVLLPGSLEGIKFLFHFDPADFTRPRIYLEALSQSAWSTGAGWGLLLTYAIYSRSREKVVGNALIMALGNNTASLLAALAVIPTVFAVLPAAEALRVVEMTGENSTGLTFIWIPRLLGASGGGQYLLVLFFLGLSLAALSSLISMVEMAVRNLIDLGLGRRAAASAVTVFIALAGGPSALDSTFFDNQDWVWGLGLMVNGLLLALAVRSFGARRFREEMVNLPGGGDIRLGPVFDRLVVRGLPFQFAVLMGWWFYRSAGWDPANWWNPLSTFSIGTCLAQWGLAAALATLAGPWLLRRLGGR